MDTPQIRPGLVKNTDPMPRVIAFFRNSAAGNTAIQMLTMIGVPGDRLGVTTPDQIETNQGMLLSVGCPTTDLIPRVEAVCRQYGAEIHRTRR